ncbi:MAG: hypothetical protein GY782_04245 [Gammaproteobacteria bacterium]|nr:hypothetical protein [Gammaproteobacteria bacterium]
MEKQASERDQARVDALQQYTHTVKKHAEEQEHLAQDQAARLARLVQHIESAGLSEVIEYADSQVLHKHRSLSPSQDNARDTARDAREDEKPYTKTQRMRQDDRKQWLDHELKRVDPCSGTPKHKARVWITHLRAARQRFTADLATPIFPERSPAQVATKWIHKVVEATATGDLLESVDNYYAENPGSTSTTKLLDHLQEVYLGTDDKDAVIAELASMRQSNSSRQENATPVYARKFRIKANQAYGRHRSDNEERHLIRMFTQSLSDVEVQRIVLRSSPRSLNEAVDTSIDTYNLEEKLIGLNKGKHDSHTRMETPMEVDGSKHLSKQIKAMQESLRQLQKSNNTSSNGSTSASGGKSCNYCNRKGHVAKDCRKKANEVGATGGQAKGKRA